MNYLDLIALSVALLIWAVFYAVVELINRRHMEIAKRLDARRADLQSKGGGND